MPCSYHFKAMTWQVLSFLKKSFLGKFLHLSVPRFLLVQRRAAWASPLGTLQTLIELIWGKAQVPQVGYSDPLPREVTKACRCRVTCEADVAPEGPAGLRADPSCPLPKDRTCLPSSVRKFPAQSRQRGSGEGHGAPSREGGCEVLIDSGPHRLREGCVAIWVWTVPHNLVWTARSPCSKGQRWGFGT